MKHLTITKLLSTSCSLAVYSSRVEASSWTSSVVVGSISRHDWAIEIAVSCPSHLPYQLVTRQHPDPHIRPKQVVDRLRYTVLQFVLDSGAATVFQSRFELAVHGPQPARADVFLAQLSYLGDILRKPLVLILCDCDGF
jgi:hypothetical protein